jgi:hypothetical protein
MVSKQHARSLVEECASVGTVGRVPSNAFGLSCGPSKRSYFWLSQFSVERGYLGPAGRQLQPAVIRQIQIVRTGNRVTTASAPADAQGGAVNCCVLAPPRIAPGP